MTRYVIIGQGAAGTSAARALRQIDRQAAITMVSAEPESFYSRVDLPDIVAGRLQPAEATLLGAEGFGELGIECRMDHLALRIRPAEKLVDLSSGACLAYDRLLLATGSEPVVPPIPGMDARGVYRLWTMGHARAIAEAARSAGMAVVIGAGLIGLKAALALKHRGLAVTVVERMPRVMGQQLDETAAGMVAEKVAGLGLQLLTGTRVDALETVGGHVTGVVLDRGRLPADMVVVAVGVRPNAALGREANLATRRGLVTDEFLETSVPGIYAAGDVAEVADLVTGQPAVPAIWPAAVEQGRIAAANMAGERVSYDGATAMNAVELAGLPLISVGRIDPGPGERASAVRTADTYRKVVARGDTVCGVLFVGGIHQAGVAANLVLRKADAGKVDILSPMFSFAGVMAR